MPKLLAFFVLFYSVLFTLNSPALVLAANIKVIHDPNPFFSNSGTLTITVKSDEPIFKPDSSDYSFEAKGPSCSLDSFLLPEADRRPKDTQTFVITKDMNRCSNNMGFWTFQLWVGRGTDALNASSLIAKDSFEVQQAGGQTPTISAVKSPLGVTEVPQVSLTNARSNNSYTFWWNGSSGIEKVYKAQNNDNVLIDLNKVTDTGTRRLCMEIGDYLTTWGLTCRFPATFDFKAIPPPAQSPSSSPGTPGSCKIKIYAAHDPILKKDDSVSAVVINLSPNKRFQVELTNKKNGDLIIDPIEQSSTLAGAMTLPLKDHIDIGDYTVTVKTSGTDKALCTEDFSANADGTPIETKNCGDKGVTCTKAGEDSGCDVSGGRGPGIKTAIGCVHTSPAEFVKDVMTFVIGISGGLAFLLMILGAFQMLTSAGNPDTLRAGRERLTSAIIGLLIVIFATLLLQIIGLDILQIPGFKR